MSNLGSVDNYLPLIEKYYAKKENEFGLLGGYARRYA